MAPQLSLNSDMSISTFEKAIETKMAAAGVASPAITAFLGALRRVAAGERGMVSEIEVDAIQSLPRLDDIPEPASGSELLLKQLVVIKLNGGLGTGMGLESAKSLLEVKDGDTFLDFIARQILQLRERTGSREETSDADPARRCSYAAAPVHLASTALTVGASDRGIAFAMQRPWSRNGRQFELWHSGLSDSFSSVSARWRATP